LTHRDYESLALLQRLYQKKGFCKGCVGVAVSVFGGWVLSTLMNMGLAGIQFCSGERLPRAKFVYQSLLTLFRTALCMSK